MSVVTLVITYPTMNKPKANKRPRKDTLETRRQIVDAAEALFAEHGLDNVTLQDITRAAGQNNRYAPQYHFGDRAGLINAVLDKHSDLISERRKLLLEALAQKKSPTLRELVDAYVLPVAQHVESNKNNLAYLLINCQLMTSGSFGRLSVERATRYPEVQQLMGLMNKVMAKDSRARRQSKILLIQSMVFHGLAAFYVSSAPYRSEFFIQTLCASVEAVLEVQA
jgi:AcrR family transcriptional regulator